MAKKYITLILIFLTAKNAVAFDRLACESKLNEWIVVINPDDNKTAVITADRRSAFLTSKQSETLTLKNEDNKVVATVFPWNSLYIRENKDFKEKYKIKSIESELGFHIEIVEIQSKTVRSFYCRFTF